MLATHRYLVAHPAGCSAAARNKPAWLAEMPESCECCCPPGSWRFGIPFLTAQKSLLHLMQVWSPSGKRRPPAGRWVSTGEWCDVATLC